MVNRIKLAQSIDAKSYRKLGDVERCKLRGLRVKDAPNGLILWRGPSQLDPSQNVVVIATGFAGNRSANDKTGQMIQIWYLLEDVHPAVAVSEGADGPICGDCPFKSGEGCYVDVAKAPAAVWRAYRAGSYTEYNEREHLHWFVHEGVRFGAYGDPTSAPFGVISPIARVARLTTGYTHQWKQGRFWRFRAVLMASTHSVEQFATATARGWRSFRSAADEPAQGEIVCPASDMGGYRRQCITCGACDGAGERAGRASVFIPVHGSKPKLAAANRALSELVA